MHEGAKNILRIAGLGLRVALIEAGQCPMCKKKIQSDEFLTPLDRKEHEVTGLCQVCITANDEAAKRLEEQDDI